MRYKSIIWHLLLIHCFSNTALINLNTDIKAKLIKMSRVISIHRECSLGIIFNEKGFFKNSKNEIMPLLQSYSNFLVFKNPWGAVFKILHLCFLFFSIRWKGPFPNAGEASQSTTVLVFKNTGWDQRTVEICLSWLFWERNDTDICLVLSDGLWYYHAKEFSFVLSVLESIFWSRGLKILVLDTAGMSL